MVAMRAMEIMVMVQKDSNTHTSISGMTRVLCQSIVVCIVALVMAACGSYEGEEFDPSDRSMAVSFGRGQMGYDLGASTVLRVRQEEGEHTPGTKAEDGYRWYSPKMHPTTMGMWASCDGEQIWNNLQHTYANNGDKWEYSKPLGWGNDLKYTDWTEDARYEFCCYMPYAASGVTYRNKILTIANQPLITADADKAQRYYITHDLLHANGSGPGQDRQGNRICPSKMDLIYARYQLEFKLGTQMNQIRRFEITGIKVYDTAVKAQADFARDYDLKKDILTEVVGSTASSSKKVLLTGTLRINAQDNSSWLPYCSDGTSSSAGSTPSYFYILKGHTLEHIRLDITYNVYDLAGAMTRQNVTSSLTLSIRQDGQGNFTTTGHHTVNRIQIQIVPSYLYVLSENDDPNTLIID